MCENVDTIIQLIKQNNETELYKYINCQVDTPFSQSDFYMIVDSFSTELRDTIKKCVNICGSGGSGLIKPNLSSIASLYVSMISNCDVMKSGSVSRSGVSGSTDFFKEMGILGYVNKNEILEKYHWGYCDRLELSLWKKYKEILSCNVYLKEMIKNHIVHDYQPRLMLLGIAKPDYIQGLKKYIHYHTPGKIVYYCTLTKQGYIDEATPGTLMIDDQKHAVFDDIEYDVLYSKKDVECINMGLLSGTCESLFWEKALFITVVMALVEIGFSNSIDDMYEQVNDVYIHGGVKSFCEKIKKDCRW